MPKKRKSDTFELILAAAQTGGRAPRNRDICVSHLRDMIGEGTLRVRLYSTNFRQMEFITGEHKGLITAGPDRYEEPWRIIDDTNFESGYIRPKSRSIAHSCEIFGGFDDAELARKYNPPPDHLVSHTNGARQPLTASHAQAALAE